jgi:hypothetical protein
MQQRDKRASAGAHVRVRVGIASLVGLAVLAVVVAPAGSASAGAGCARFAKPVVLPGSAGTPGQQLNLPGPTPALAVEPSITAGPRGELYVTGATTANLAMDPHVPRGHSTPVWTSADEGRSWRGPYASANAATADGPTGGMDADIVVDKRGWLYMVSMWLGSAAVGVSADGGRTWFANPIGHPSPMDDRPWLAYDAHSDALYLTWDASDGLHVGKAVLRPLANGTVAQPYASLLFAQDVIAVLPTGTEITDRAGVIHLTPVPAGLVTDPGGDVWLSYVDNNSELAVVRSTDGGLTWSAPTLVPGGWSIGNSSAHHFAQARSDAHGNVYLAWVGAQKAGGKGQAFYSWYNARTGRWSHAARVSGANVLDVEDVALAVVSPKVIDIAFYGVDQPGESRPRSIYLAQVPVERPALAHTQPALRHFWTRRAAWPHPYDQKAYFLGDFFTMTVSRSGMAGIISNADVSGAGRLVFVRQTTPFCR